ncbi:MAG: DUF262 domain-containing HNH endonuclease family protein, partial [Chryseobacterium sp.]
HYMSVTNFNTENNSFGKLIGNGVSYQIPPFQRDYSWGEEEWEELWHDIRDTVKEGGESVHYMGYLVLRSYEKSDTEVVYDVIDGQQRLTTLSLIVLAALKNLRNLVIENTDADNNTKRIEELRRTYIGYLDPVTLHSKTKLILNRNNNDYFQSYIVPLTDPLPQHGFKASERSLRKGFLWFVDRLVEYTKDIKENKGEALASFISKMSNRLVFTAITVTDELNAYKVFETLNARGVRLSATDLLKNHLFSVLYNKGQTSLHENDIKLLENKWEIMVGRLGSESFPDFLRIHWNSRYNFVRASELFKTIRKQIRKREDAFDLLRNIDIDIEHYLELVQPDNHLKLHHAQESLSTLKMFGIKQPLALLLAARRQFSDADFETLLHICVVISLRYNVIGNLPPNEQEIVYNKAARRIASKEINNLAEIFPELKTIYPPDEKFKADFSEKIIKTNQSTRNNRIVKYLLGKIQSHLYGVEPDIESDNVTVEHILPQNPELGWENFSSNDTESYVYRIGNMTLLNKSDNKISGNTSYDKKREIYRNASNFPLTQKIAQDYNNWTTVTINSYQKNLAAQAAARWRITQLSGK